MDAAEQPWTADRRILRLLEYWRRQRPARGRLPARVDIDPVELGSELIPYIALIDVVDGGARFRFRLVGTQLAVEAGLDLSGRFVDELNPNRDYADYITGLYQRTMREKTPTYSETLYRAGGGRIGRSRRLLCPLAADGETVDMFVGAQVMSTDDALGDPPTMTFAAGFEPAGLLVLRD